MNEEITILQQRIQKLEDVLNFLVRPDRYVFERPVVGGTSGLKIGQTLNSKMSFYGLATIIQPSSVGESVGVTTGVGDINENSTFTGNNGATAYTLSDVVKHLKNLGLLKK